MESRIKIPSPGPTWHRTGGWGRKAAIVGIAAILFFVATVSHFEPGTAGAAGSLPELLTQIPPDGESGSTAGRLWNPRSVATNPVNGHIYVSEGNNNRISEFTAWGTFVKAWGWGVADGVSKELQTCTTSCFQGLLGAGTGEFRGFGGISVDSSGNVYVVDSGNNRVEKFSPAGDFLAAWGGDVVARGPDNSTNDEQQEIVVAASSGTFKLSFADAVLGGSGNATTAALPYNATAAEVQAALNGLSTISSHGGTVSVSGGPGDPTGSSAYLVTFEGGLAGDDVPQLKIDRSALGAPASGAKLACSTETFAQNIEYAWLQNGQPIAGASSPTYTTTAADEGKAIQCQISAINSNAGAIGVANPAYVDPPQPATALPTGEVEGIKIIGGLAVGGAGGTTITCPTERVHGAISFSYRWYRNGEQIAGASGQSYEVTSANLASSAVFQCEVIAANAGGAVAIASEYLFTEPRPTPVVPGSEKGHPFEANASMEPIRTVAQGGGPEVCQEAAGDVCKAGDGGTANGQFPDYGRFPLALGPGDTIYVGGNERIQEFEPDGAYKGQIPTPGAIVQALAVDKSGDVYVTFDGGIADNTEPNVEKLSPTGAKLNTLEVQNPTALATNAAGDLYVLAAVPPGEGLFTSEEIVEYGPSGEPLFAIGSGFARPPLNAGYHLSELLGTNSVGDVLVATTRSVGGNLENYLTVYGPPPVSLEPPPAVAPDVVSEYATSVDPHGALLHAQINPRFWTDARYFVQYGPADCAQGGCTDAPIAPGSLLMDGSVNRPVSGRVSVSGLNPDTEYHYRFAAQSGGGGPVYGPDRTFTTFPLPGAPSQDCANAVLRVGASAALVDCRAFEMVSPVDKNGGDVEALSSPDAYGSARAALDESALSGERLTYSAYRAYGDAQSAPWSSQYLASRGAGGWSNHGISPPRELSSLTGMTTEFANNQFREFSPDLSLGWLAQDSNPLLASGAVPGYVNLYRRNDVTESYETLTNVKPASAAPSGYGPELQGVSADGKDAIFDAPDKLTPEALSGLPQLYYATAGSLHLVSVLPNGTVSTTASMAGVQYLAGVGDRQAAVQHAISADGSRVFWTALAGKSIVSASGSLYVRENPAQEQSAIEEGECVESTKACTIAISRSVSTAPARFWLASADGSKVVFSFVEGVHDGDLYEFDVASRQATLIAHKADGVVGASEDLSYLYFVSREAIPGTSGSVEGQLNMYVMHESKTVFVTTLRRQDVSESPTDDAGLSNTSGQPDRHFARVTPDGRHVVFISNASLTGYDNIDAGSGEGDAEVYRYDAVAGKVACISCNRSGARPEGRFDGDNEWMAAMLPAWENGLYQPRYVSDDGDRVFFDSYDALVARDTNGKEDVYEWEAPGAGECSEQSSSYSPPNEGCVSLISTGESPQDSLFVDASSNGNDVFIQTASSLVPQDPGAIDIYDARVGGGFALPITPAECEGEACQPSPVPALELTPGSFTFTGTGNLVSPPAGATTPKSRPLTRMQKLAGALRACQKKPKRARAVCRAKARRRYGPKGMGSRSSKTRGANTNTRSGS